MPTALLYMIGRGRVWPRYNPTLAYHLKPAAATSGYFDRRQRLVRTNVRKPPLSLNSGESFLNEFLVGTKLYLDLGGALAALGLIFAVYQLRQPNWDVVLQIRPWWQRYLFWILGVAGLILTLIAVLLDRFQPAWLPLWLSDTLPYQILAYFAFAGSPMSLLWFANRRDGLFTHSSASRFCDVLMNHIATRDERDVDAVLGVLLANFEIICQYTNDWRDTACHHARFILGAILSDSAIVDVLTTKRLDGLLYIFSCAETVSTMFSYRGFPRLLRNLYFDPDSFFYKQNRDNDLISTMNIYETIFGSAALLAKFEPFGYPALDYSMRPRIGAAGVDVLIESLSRSIKTYLISGRVPAGHINAGFEYISEIFGDRCMRADREREGNNATFPRTPAWETIDKIAHFLGHDLLFIAAQTEWDRSIIQSEAVGSDDGFASSISISPAIAEALCEAVSQLSSIDKAANIFWSYQTVVELLHGLMLEDSAFSADYRRAFETGIWKRIHANVVRRFFPATLRTYLEFMGFLLVFSGSNRGAWAENQKERIRRLLYVDLRPLFDRAETMINGKSMQEALLPQVMRYQNGRFYYRARFGEGEESQIDEPARDASSALEGIRDQYDGMR